ncbi:hypothetical protein [Vibrio pomeroyi]|uniref:hypothetical protein n=1 Tax=Vibrio pomeroyi TaxID=198832 RepID=UPI0035A6D691
MTNDFNRRKMQHFTSLAMKGHINYKLQDYFEEHKDDITMYVFKEFDTEDKAYRFEATLRPHANIGLNIASGGKKEYHERFESKSFRNEHKPKGFFGYIKTLLRAANHNLDSWAADSVHKAKTRKKRLETWSEEFERSIEAQKAAQQTEAKKTMTFKKPSQSVINSVITEPTKLSEEAKSKPLINIWTQQPFSKTPNDVLTDEEPRKLSKEDQAIIDQWLDTPYPAPNGNSTGNVLTGEELKGIWVETPKKESHEK